VNAGSSGVAIVEALDPGRGGPKQRRLSADDQNRIEPAHGLKFHDVLAETALAGIHDLLEFGDDRFRSAVGDGINSDRLTSHPVDVETENSVHGRAAFRPAALDQKDIPRRVGANHSRFRREAVHQLQHCLRGNILQGHHGHAVAGFGTGGGRIDAARADRLAEGGETVACGIANQHDAAEPQRVFENKDDVRLRDRLDRHKADGALHPRINRVARAQNVAQYDFGHRRDGRVFKIELEAVSTCGRLRPCVGNVSHLGAIVNRRAASLASRLNGIHLLRLTRKNVQRTNLIEHINIGGVAGPDRRGIARR
jgi:hypothetical protein